MRIKRFIAATLAFGMLFCLCSCHKIETSGTVTKYYVETNDGQEFEVQTSTNPQGETEYFYVDNTGSVITLEAEKTVTGGNKFYTVDTNGNKAPVNVNTVTQEVTNVYADTTDYSFTPEQESFIDKFENEKYKDYLDNNAEGAELEMGDEAHNLSNATPVTVDTNNEQFFDNLNVKDKYTLKMTMRNGTTVMPMTVIKSGNKMYIESSMPVDESGSGSMTCFIIIKDKKAKIYIPNLKGYYEADAENIDDIVGSIDLNNTAPEGAVKEGTVQTQLDGKTYTVDIYHDGKDTIYYYYDNGTPKRIEYTSANGDVSICEYNQISYTADESKFNEPSNYYNMSDLMYNAAGAF